MGVYGKMEIGEELEALRLPLLIATPHDLSDDTLAGSITREPLIRVTKLDQIEFPIRLTIGISLLAPERRDPTTSSAPSRACLHKIGKYSGG